MDAVLTLILLALICAILYSLVGIVRPLPPLRSRKSWLGAAAGSFLALGIFASFLPEPPPSTPEPTTEAAAATPNTEASQPVASAPKQESVPQPNPTPTPVVSSAPETALDKIRKASGKDVEIEEASDLKGLPRGTGIRVTYAVPGAITESDLISFPAITYLRVAKAVAAHGDTYSGIEFLARARSVDPYNRTKMSDVLIWRIAQSELAKIQWEDFSSRQLLGLSDVEMRLLGPSAVRAYCEDKPAMAERFCRIALR